MKQYRGLTKDGKWVYGWYAEYQGEPVIYSATEKPWLSHKVIPSTVGQQTGLKDKHGTEIYYDSDIVEYTYQIDNDVEQGEEVRTGIVVLDTKFTNSLCVKSKGGALYHFTASELRNIEVIGNVHQEKQ